MRARKYRSSGRNDKEGEVVSVIYVSGDTHGEIGRFCERNMPGESTWGEQDKLIICGDFGFVFAPEEYEGAMRQERWKLDQLEKKPYQILFVSGNHENFERLQRAEQVPLYGGTAFRIRSNIFLLRRGEIYEIEGKKIFTMGALTASIDTCASLIRAGGRRSCRMRKSTTAPSARWKKRTRSSMSSSPILRRRPSSACWDMCRIRTIRS